MPNIAWYLYPFPLGPIFVEGLNVKKYQNVKSLQEQTVKMSMPKRGKKCEFLTSVTVLLAVF